MNSKILANSLSPVTFCISLVHMILSSYSFPSLLEKTEVKFSPPKKIKKEKRGSEKTEKNLIAKGSGTSNVRQW